MTILEDLNAAVAAFSASKESRRARRHDTDLKVYNQTQSDIMAPFFFSIGALAKKADEMPKRNSYAYIQWLDNLWKEEPILAGAVYSMVAKMQSMTWKVEGGKINASRIARMLSRTRYMGGSDWSGFIGATAIDFYTQDNGIWWDVSRDGNSKWGRVSDLAYIDTRNCITTGNTDKPMYYRSSIVNDEHWYATHEMIHFSSMSLPDEREFGIGFCAVSRAARAAKLLMALHQYDSEKMSNLPPEGVASVTGLTDREFRQAIQMWLAEREKNNSLTFPQVLWLIGSNPGAKVSVDMTPFSTLPESFDRSTIVVQYVNTLALCFGVDAREFWSISSGALGTSTEAEVQHMKARGKGGGEFITMVEQHLNAEFPEDVTFIFDTQDIEEDLVSAEVAAKWIDAYIKLLYPPNPLSGDPVLNAREFKRLLAERGVLPEWLVGDEKIAVMSHDIHKEELEDIVRFVWDVGGRLKEYTILDLSRYARREVTTIDGVAVTKDDPDNGNKLRGKPIRDDEVDRGASVTANAVKSLYDWWGEIPELSDLVPAGEVNASH